MINAIKSRYVLAISIVILGVTISGCCQKKKCIKKEIGEIKEICIQKSIEPIIEIQKEEIKPSINIKQLIEEDLYKNISGFNIDDSERKLVTDKGGSPVYGEIKYDSLQTVLNDLNIKSTDVFYDLGSGVGKATIQAYLNFPFKKAVGVELSPTRSNNAEKIKKQLEAKGLIKKNRKLEFHQGDIGEYNINDATVIYMCSTCYPTELMNKLAQNFSKLKPGLIVISLKSIPEYEKFGLKLVKEYSLPMTWSEGSPVHVYKLEKIHVAVKPQAEKEKIKKQIADKKKQISKLEKEINELEARLHELEK